MIYRITFRTQHNATDQVWYVDEHLQQHLDDILNNPNIVWYKVESAQVEWKVETERRREFRDV